MLAFSRRIGKLKMPRLPSGQRHSFSFKSILLNNLYKGMPNTGHSVCARASSLYRGKDDAAAAVIINSLCCVHTHSISKSLHATQLGNPKPSQPVQPVPLSTCGTPQPHNQRCFNRDLTQWIFVKNGCLKIENRF